ncbi:MAG TPA: hypothetical protein VFA65_14245, partial [Bryobacteraceae bacterium]|nr:hypothetical protein [Bryobacteraceae bacterium]
MILPVSHTSALLLLIASLICLGCWVNTFKAAGPRWRFELFSIDFSIGAVFLVVLAAFTLGTLGSDLGFSDRILVAGRTAQGLAIIAGGVFNLGNMLLLAAVSLLGITTAFPLSVGVALIVSSCLHFRSTNMVYLIVGSVVMLAAVLFEIRSAQLHEPVTASKKDSTLSHSPQPATTVARAANDNSRRNARSSKPASPTLNSKHRKRSMRGIVAAIIS